MKKLKTIFLLLIILISFEKFGQQSNFAQEKTYEGLVNEFEEMKINDVSKTLNQMERKEIVRLITKSYIKIVRQKQSDYVSSQTPLYLLLKNNYPNIKEREEERGVSLGNIVKFLNSMPENREIINSILAEQKTQKCY